MLGDPRSGSNVWEALDREIGKPGENRGQIVAHRWIVDAGSGKRENLNWMMSREKREAQDRPIEAALRPRMIDQFLTVLPTLVAEIRDEFETMKTAIKSWRSSPAH